MVSLWAGTPQAVELPWPQSLAHDSGMKPVDELLSRASKAWPSYRAGLDDTTLGKCKAPACGDPGDPSLPNATWDVRRVFRRPRRRAAPNATEPDATEEAPAEEVAPLPARRHSLEVPAPRRSDAAAEVPAAEAKPAKELEAAAAAAEAKAAQEKRASNERKAAQERQAAEVKAALEDAAKAKAAEAKAAAEAEAAQALTADAESVEVAAPLAPREPAAADAAREEPEARQSLEVDKRTREEQGEKSKFPKPGDVVAEAATEDERLEAEPATPQEPLEDIDVKFECASEQALDERLEAMLAHHDAKDYEEPTATIVDAENNVYNEDDDLAIFKYPVKVTVKAKLKARVPEVLFENLPGLSPQKRKKEVLSL